MLGAKTSQHCEPDQTVFARGAYTESDNAPAQKIGSGYARLCMGYVYTIPACTYVAKYACIHVCSYSYLQIIFILLIFLLYLL